MNGTPQGPVIAGESAMGLAAKQLCSLIFVSGFDPYNARTIYLDQLLSHFNLDLDIDVDYDTRKVTVSSPSFISATAIMKDWVGYGFNPDVHISQNF